MIFNVLSGHENHVISSDANTHDIFNKQSLARIVGYALKTKRFLTPEEKDQSGVT